VAVARTVEADGGSKDAGREIVNFGVARGVAQTLSRPQPWSVSPPATSTVPSLSTVAV
jgi:hypothetical protein